MSIVLASSSPRRRELLEKTGLKFDVAVSPAEEIHDHSLPPEVLCERNAELKAQAVASLRPQDTVIGSDTLVFIDGQALGKPRDLDEARAMLQRLSGRTHHVCTGVCIIHPGDRRHCFHGNTDVTFKSLSADDIDTYFQHCDPLDKAGAYGIQESGDLIVEGIRGSFDNVMGLPTDLVLAALSHESSCESAANE